MSSSAYIATNLNLAFLIGKNTSEIIDGKTGASQPLDGYLYSQIRALQPEIKEISFTTKATLQAIMTSEFEKQEALSMALEIMDTNLSEDYRNAISLLLDKEINEKPALLNFIQNRFYSTALPDSFNYNFINAENKFLSQELIELYADLKEKARLFNCFETAFKLTLNIDIDKQFIIDTKLTDNGCYAAFTNALYNHSEKDFDGAMILAVTTLEAEHIFKTKKLFNEVKEKLHENYNIILGGKLRLIAIAANVGKNNDPIIVLIEKYFEKRQEQNDKKLGKRGKAKRVKDYDSEIEQSVTEMKEWILQNSSDDTSFFNEFLSLAEKQLRSGKPKHLCKTCCDLAAVFIENKNYLISEKLLNYAEILNPEDKYVFNQKAVLNHKLRQFELALTKYDEAILKFDDNFVAYNGKAEVLRDMGRYEDALTQYEEAILKFDNDQVAYCGRAEVLRDMRRYEDALAQYDEAILKFSYEHVAYCGKAEVLREMGKYTDALAQYDEAILKFNKDHVAYCGKAEVLRDIGRFEDALAQYDEAILKFSNEHVAYCGRAEVLRDMNRYEDALAQYDKAILKFSNEHFAYSGKAEVLRDMDRYEDALTQYEEAILKFDNDRVAYCGRAEVLRDMRRYEDALAQYNEAILKFSYEHVAYCGKAEVLREMGRYAAALVQYDEAILKFSNENVAYCGKAEVLREMGKYDEALEQYEEAILKFNNDQVAYCGKAEVLRDMGRYEDALTQYYKAILKFSNEHVAYSGKAEVLREMGRYADALALYDESILKFSNKHVAYSGRAEVLKEMGRYADALEQYDEAILKHSNEHVAYCGKAEVLRDMGRYEDALTQYEKAISKFKNEEIAYNSKAEVLRDMGRTEDALTQYEKNIKLFPFNEFTKRGRLQLLLEMNEYEEFEKSTKKNTPTTKGDFIELHMYCMYLFKTGDWDLAEEKIKIGLKCPFLESRKYFTSLSIYLKILKNQFSIAITELNLIKVHSASQSLLFIHANAEQDNKPKAVEELHKLEINKRPVIHKTLTYLSERYSLNGFTKTGKSQAELDILINEGEMMALMQY